MNLKKEKPHMKERIQEIDIAKGIGILLVIAGHSVPYGSSLHTWIYSFHMPLFFLLSGLVMNVPNDVTFRGLCGKNMNLITNYLFWSGIYFMFDLIVRFAILRQASFHSMFWEGYQTITLYGINVLWFFSTLVIAKMITAVILKNRNLQTSIIIGGALFVGSVAIGMIIGGIELTSLTSLVIYPTISVVRSLFAVLFLVLGYMMKPLVEKYLNKSGGGQCAFLGLISILITFACSLKVGTVDIHALRFGNPIILLVSSLSGFVGVMCFSKLISFNQIGAKALIFLGINSSLIMVTHEYLKIKDLISFVLGHYINVGSNMYIIIEIILLTFIEICICKMFAKYADKVIDLISVFMSKKILDIKSSRK